MEQSSPQLFQAQDTPRQILITGGAGFIGSWLVRHWLRHYPGDQVINLDLLTYAGNLDNLRDVEANANYRFVHGDITDEVLVHRLMGEVDVVINVAAQTHVDRSISGPTVFVQTNVLGTQVLLEAARQARLLNGRLQKFIQISTDEVYGSLGETGHFSENSPIDPSSPYSASKTAADLLALSYFTTFGLPVCVTRCSNNYGPYQFPEKLIPLFILNASQDISLPVYGDGLNVRDWIHVEDHNAAIDRVVSDGRPGQVYNIGANNEWDNLSITRAILKHLNKPESLIRFVDDRLGHDRRYAIDSSKIQQELGWTPKHTFADGLPQTIDWYLSHPDWIENLKHRKQAEAETEFAGL